MKSSFSFEFFDVGYLADGELRLVLSATVIDEFGDAPLPTYRFTMVHRDTGEHLGFINLRVGTDHNLINYRGHIGYGVEEQHRGHGYASRACALLLPLARQSGIGKLWITCNPDNVASRKTCEKLGAQFIETLEVPEGTEAHRAGARIKCRYCVDLDALKE